MNKADICISSQMNLQIELAGSAPRSGYRYGFPNCPTNRNPTQHHHTPTPPPRVSSTAAQNSKFLVILLGTNYK